MSGVYTQSIQTLDWLDERGLSHDLCLHSKQVPGCPSCAQHFLRYFGIEPTRWNPEAFASTPAVLASFAQHASEGQRT